MHFINLSGYLAASVQIKPVVVTSCYQWVASPAGMCRPAARRTHWTLFLDESVQFCVFDTIYLFAEILRIHFNVQFFGPPGIKWTAERCAIQWQQSYISISPERQNRNQWWHRDDKCRSQPLSAIRWCYILHVFLWMLCLNYFITLLRHVRGQSALCCQINVCMYVYWTKLSFDRRM